MSRAERSHPLTKAAARRIWLRAKRLDALAPFGEGQSEKTAVVQKID
jgi:hypothetical protein